MTMTTQQAQAAVTKALTENPERVLDLAREMVAPEEAAAIEAAAPADAAGAKRTAGSAAAILGLALRGHDHKETARRLRGFAARLLEV